NMLAAASWKPVLPTNQLAIPQFKHRTGDLVLAPLHRRRSDELLGVARQIHEQLIAANWIELAENIVEEKERRRSFLQAEQLRLRDFQGQRDGSLLAFGSVLRRLSFLHEQVDIFPMRVDVGLAQA